MHLLRDEQPEGSQLRDFEEIAACLRKGELDVQLNTTCVGLELLTRRIDNLSLISASSFSAICRIISGGILSSFSVDISRPFFLNLKNRVCWL